MAVMAFVVINVAMVYHLLNSHFVRITGHWNILLNLNNNFYVSIVILMLFIGYNSILLQKKTCLNSQLHKSILIIINMRQTL